MQVAAGALDVCGDAWTPVRGGQQAGSEAAAECVGGRVADDGGDTGHDDEGGEADAALLGEDAAEDDRQLAGDEQPGERRRLREREGHDDDVGRGALQPEERVDEPVHVPTVSGGLVPALVLVLGVAGPAAPAGGVASGYWTWILRDERSSLALPARTVSTPSSSEALTSSGSMSPGSTAS